ncbi:hypothetical protein TcasGA2_TC034788 [Tribolium castaneum]|uniref:Uncharacterized protein n=1 Tax=Tribolium castaneum TaxID=7070 RepID=A0A139WE68_TRICA|nr:hypothetical protein TcasGA2_TC034788 [Tribolium castaneum]
MTSAASEAVTATGARNTKHRRITKRGVSTLMYASQQGDVERVRKIIQEQAHHPNLAKSS